MADTVTPFASIADMTSGAFGDLVRDYPVDALADALGEGTREIEDICDRRLAPFTITETHRASAIDPDEYTGSTSLPMDIQSTLGASYARSIGAENLVRHCWLREIPVRYQDLWSYSNVSVLIIRSYGGSQQLSPTQILDGPDDMGHLWFQLGLFLPAASRIRVTYSGGYTVATPASLVRANKYFTAAIVVKELNPDDVAHNPDQLYADGMKVLKDGHWIRY